MAGKMKKKMKGKGEGSGTTRPENNIKSKGMEERLHEKGRPPRKKAGTTY